MENSQNQQENARSKTTFTQENSVGGNQEKVSDIPPCTEHCW